MDDEQVRANFARQVYGIFDHDETSCIWCKICGSEAKPTRETGYDYRNVVHAANCVVPAIQARFGIEMNENHSQKGQ